MHRCRGVHPLLARARNTSLRPAFFRLAPAVTSLGNLVTQETIEDYLNGWNGEDDEDEQFSTPIDDVSLRIFFYDVSAPRLRYT